MTNNIVACVLILLILMVQLLSCTDVKFEPPCREDAPFCSGKVLQKVQMSGIFNDSKEFVDMPLKQNWSRQIEEEILNTNNLQELKSKLDQYFYKAGTREWHPETISVWKKNPNIIDKIKDKNYKDWAKFLCSEWKVLIRKINLDVRDNNQRYSMIYLSENLVVPGGRFREIYYWDTYWSIVGLLHCELYDTTKKVLQNLLHLVNTYGFIPNGGRKYYENRSQPPFLTLMVLKYYKSTNDTGFVVRNFQTLVKEYDFWMKNRVVDINVAGKTYRFNRYFSKLGFPRPESYKEDKELVGHIDVQKQQEMYSNIATAAESGWDFSTRWFEDAKTMTTIRTKEIIPVDLNSILCAVEYSLAFLAKYALKNTLKSNLFIAKAKSRHRAIHEVLWDSKKSVWSDYLIKEQKLNENFYASSFFPMWIENFDYTASSIFENSTRKKLAYHAFSNLKLFSFPGGLPASLIESGQQWDFPNAWAPLQHVAVHGLDSNDRLTITSTARKRAGKELAQKFLKNSYLAWKQTGYMFEKYNVKHLGKEGHGGEYVTQTGFGWTNGVVLDFLNKYGGSIESPPTPDSTASSSYSLQSNLLTPPHPISTRMVYLIAFLSYTILITMFVYF